MTTALLMLVLLLQPWSVDPTTTMLPSSSSVSADPWLAVVFDPVHGAIEQPVVYTMVRGQAPEMVCPVADAIVLEPHFALMSSLDETLMGSFYVRSSTKALFMENSRSNLVHIRQQCHSDSVPGTGICDLLYISGLSSLRSQGGSFSVRYRPPNENIVEIIMGVLYGPQGIILEGSGGDGPFVIPPDLSFLLRTPVKPSSRRMVCEVSGDDDSLTESTVLQALSPFPVQECRPPISGTNGGLSSLARISIRLGNEDTVLTPREVAVAFGSNCTNTDLMSRIISVTGQRESTTAELTTELEVTTDTTSPAVVGTEDMGVTPDSSMGGFSSLAVPETTGGPDATSGGGSPNSMIIIIVALVTLSIIVVVVITCVFGRCKLNKRKEGKKSSDVENQNNNQELQRTEPSKIPNSSHTGPIDVVDGNGVIHERHAYASSASVPNTLTIQDSVVAVNRDCEASLPGAPGIIDNKAMHVAKESSRSGSVSESESEGSGVALLKEISKNTEVIAKAITKPDVMAHNLLARIDCRTEETCALANHIAGKVDEQIEPHTP